jgi:hypothetical protein
VKEFREVIEKVSEEKDAQIRRLHARCEGLEAALKSCTELVDAHQDRTDNLKQLVESQRESIKDLTFVASVRGDYQRMQEKILLRARHLEVHAEYLSLGFPPTGTTLPNLTSEEWSHWKSMVWCRDEAEREKVEELEKKYWDHADVAGDFRMPSVHALVNGKTIPHPAGPVTDSKPPCYLVPGIEFRHLCYLPVDSLPDYPTRRGKRARSVTPYPDATPETSEDEEYWMEPARQQQQQQQPQGNGSGPSSPAINLF